MERYNSVCATYQAEPLDFLNSSPRGVLLEHALAHFGAVYILRWNVVESPPPLGGHR